MQQHKTKLTSILTKICAWFSPRIKKEKVRLILQSEVSECGLACIGMIFNYFGLKIDLNTLRNTNSSSLNGISLTQLFKISEKYHFTSQAIKLPTSQINTIKLPCILFWNNNHFVVLAKIKNGKFTIYDPAYGIKKFKIEEFNAEYSGIAVEIEPAAHFVKKNLEQKLSLAQFFQKFKALKKKFALVISLTILIQVCALIGPLYMQKIIDQVKFHRTDSYLIFLALLFISLKIFESITGFIRSKVLLVLKEHLQASSAKRMFLHLLKLPVSFFEKRTVGSVLTKFGMVAKIHEILSTAVAEGLIDGAISISTLIVIFIYDIQMACVVLTSSAIYIIFRLVSFKHLAYLEDKETRLKTAETSSFIETVRSITAMKIFTNEKMRYANWQNKFSENQKTGSAREALTFLSETVKKLVSGVEIIIVVLLGAIAIEDKNFSVGMLYAFLFYRNQFNVSANNLIEKYIDYKSMQIYSDQLSDIALQKPERIEIKKLKLQGTIKKIQVRNLYFRYHEFDNYILKNVSFDVSQGENIVITGPSGSGKTTLLKVLMGIFQPSNGEILVNDINLSSINQFAYRSRISAVLQEDILLFGMVYQNISFFSDKINFEKIIESAKLAGVHDEIMSWPMQYQTIINEAGNNVSGGQKQRILLARALYKEPEIIFLDEASSHLDISKEKEINTSIQKINITRISVAHRSETIKMADRVIDLKEFPGTS